MEKEIIVKVEEAVQDKAFVECLLAAETVEAAQAVFASKGIEFSLEEVKLIGDGLKNKLESDELSENDLEVVVGGVLGTIATVVGIISGVVTIVDFAGKRFGWWK